MIFGDKSRRLGSKDGSEGMSPRYPNDPHYMEGYGPAKEYSDFLSGKTDPDAFDPFATMKTEQQQAPEPGYEVYDGKLNTWQKFVYVIVVMVMLISIPALLLTTGYTYFPERYGYHAGYADYPLIHYCALMTMALGIITLYYFKRVTRDKDGFENKRKSDPKSINSKVPNWCFTTLSICLPVCVICIATYQPGVNGSLLRGWALLISGNLAIVATVTYLIWSYRKTRYNRFIKGRGGKL